MHTASAARTNSRLWGNSTMGRISPLVAAIGLVTGLGLTSCSGSTGSDDASVASCEAAMALRTQGGSTDERQQLLDESLLQARMSQESTFVELVGSPSLSLTILVNHFFDSSKYKVRQVLLLPCRRQEHDREVIFTNKSYFRRLASANSPYSPSRSVGF